MAKEDKPMAGNFFLNGFFFFESLPWPTTLLYITLLFKTDALDIIFIFTWVSLIHNVDLISNTVYSGAVVSIKMYYQYTLCNIQ